MLFKNATIYTMEQDPFVGDFRIDKGVFTQVGTNLTPDVGENVQDLNGLYVFPGLVESHCHLGMEETAIRFESAKSGSLCHQPLLQHDYPYLLFSCKKNIL